MSATAINLQKEFEVSQNKGSYKYCKLTITKVADGGKDVLMQELVDIITQYKKAGISLRVLLQIVRNLYKQN